MDPKSDKKTISLSLNLKDFQSALGIVTKFLIILIVLSSLIAISVIGYLYSANELQKRANPNIYESDNYSIVFLENNLFYFCIIKDYNQDFIECQNPYYLIRRNETLEDGTREERVFVTTPSEQEVYQPSGSYFLSKSKIVYITEIGDESAVMEYILQNQ